MLTVISVPVAGPARMHDLLVPRSKPTRMVFVLAEEDVRGEEGVEADDDTMGVEEGTAATGFSRVAVVMFSRMVVCG